MATPTEPVTDALYQALSSPEPDPQVVHAAIEEIRYLSGHNVISTIGAQLTEFRAELDTRLTRIEAEIKTQGARLDDLRQVIWRVIWPLIVLLAVPVFGLLYKVLTTTLSWLGEGVQPVKNTERYRHLRVDWVGQSITLCGVEGEDIGAGQALCPDCAQVGEALNVCGLGPESLRELFDTLLVFGPSEVKAKMEALRGLGVRMDMQDRSQLN